jgi:hypothetical protein
MTIKITHPSDWNDSQSFICMACSKHAVLKIEARVGVSAGQKEWGPAQTLRLCRNHADITYGYLFDELTRLERAEVEEVVRVAHSPFEGASGEMTIAEGAR